MMTVQQARIERQRGNIVYVCHRCLDDGMVEAGLNEFHPCPNCNRDAFERWSSGRYAAGNVGRDPQVKSQVIADRERFA